MKIQKLQINGFGNLQKKQIELKDHINLIYGKNESGKSTLLKCITNIFYGTSKNKKGKEISDYEKYLPWEGNDFSAKLSYVLDNGQEYEVYREFNKRNPKLYNVEGQDISSNFPSDKAKGIQFFYEQTGMEEETFLSSLAVMQQEVKLEDAKQNSIIQKVANLATTGDDTISFQKCLNQLNKRQLEEVGTARSQDRPINKVQNEIEVLQQKREQLQKIKGMKDEIEEQKRKVQYQQKQKTWEFEVLQEWKAQKEKERMEKQRITIEEEIMEKNQKQMLQLEEQKQQMKNKVNLKEDKKDRTTINFVFFLICLILSILCAIVIGSAIPKMIISSVFAAIAMLLFFLFLQQRKKMKRTKKENRKKEQERVVALEKIQLEQETIQKAIKEQQKELQKKKIEIEQSRNRAKEDLQKKYSNSSIAFEQLFLIEDIDAIHTKKQQELNELQVEAKKIEIEEKSISSQIEELAMIQETLENKKEEERELKEKGNSITLAKEGLEKAYQKMQETVTPKFTQTLSKTISHISNGKYKKVRLTSQDGLIVEQENGSYISANLLSTGTIDQLYLALRLAMTKDLSDETIPILLDESFAYYDEERLANLLEYLVKEVQNQILILTCTKREKDILENKQIPYHYIEL